VSRSSAAGALTYFIYDGAQVVCELNGAGQPTSAWAYGAAGLLDLYDETAGDYTAYAFDPAGSKEKRWVDGVLARKKDRLCRGCFLWMAVPKPWHAARITASWGSSEAGAATSSSRSAGP
jgi:hypothetical protein